QRVAVARRDRASPLWEMTAFVYQQQSLDGLEGVFLSALRGVRRDGGPWATVRASLVLRAVGLPAPLGGGVVTTPILDPTAREVAFPTRDQLADVLGLGTPGFGLGMTPAFGDKDPQSGF